MRILLDSHAFLWFVLRKPQLSRSADALISDPSNVVLVSPATCWEIAEQFKGVRTHKRVSRPFLTLAEQFKGIRTEWHCLREPWGHCARLKICRDFDQIARVSGYDHI